jgi:hypothetical protein
MHFVAMIIGIFRITMWMMFVAVFRAKITQHKGYLVWGQPEISLGKFCAQTIGLWPLSLIFNEFQLSFGVENIQQAY